MPSQMTSLMKVHRNVIALFVTLSVVGMLFYHQSQSKSIISAVKMQVLENTGAHLILRAGAHQKTRHSASVIFLHGLGDSGHGWAEQVGSQIAPAMPHVKFIFPHAEHQAVSMNGGMRMPSWYDIKGPLGGGGLREDDNAGLFKSSGRIVRDYLRTETDVHGIPASRIVLGGFSQGGAVTLYTTLSKDTPKLAGAVAMSTYLPCAPAFIKDNASLNEETPVFMAHGTADGVIEYKYAEMSKSALVDDLKMPNVDFHSYRGMGHSSCEEEMEDLKAFLQKVLPAE